MESHRKWLWVGDCWKVNIYFFGASFSKI